MDNVDGKTLGLSFFNICQRISKSALPESSKSILIKHLKMAAEKAEKYQTKSLDYDAWMAFALVKMFDHLTTPAGQKELSLGVRAQKTKP